MLRPFVSAVTAVAMLAASTTLLAQGVITEIKTPPLAASDTFVLPMAIHPAGQPPWAGWAGGRMTMHILDNTEMNVLSIGPAPGMVSSFITNPFGPASNNSQSVTKPFSAFVPVESGINVQPSVNLPLFTLNIHVKNSTGVNSDVDATFGFWNIWHVRDNPGSTFFTLRPSDYILVHSTIQDQQQLHVPGQSYYQFPTNPAHPGESNAHWLHLYESAVFHLAGGPGSTFYATFLNVATLGIDHIPEPSGIVLLAAGVICTGAGAWFRRRRTKSAA